MNKMLLGVILSLTSILAIAAPVGDSSVNDTTVKHFKIDIHTDKKTGVQSHGMQITDGGAADSSNALNRPQSTKKIIEKADSFISKMSGVGGKSADGVNVAYLYQMTGVAYSIAGIFGMPDHSGLGRFSGKSLADMGAKFKGADNVFFGDWEDVAAGKAIGTKGKNYTVFYSGDNAEVKVPTTGSATYTVQGINQYSTIDNPEGGLLTGTFNANFGQNKLSGKMTGAKNLTVAINTTIDSDTAKFSGTAKASGRDTATGISKGHFFGKNADGLAGIADFGKNHEANTSFGGVKQ